MSIKQRFKQMINKHEGWIDWQDYKQLINNRDFLKFVSHTTFESAQNCLDKGE